MSSVVRRQRLLASVAGAAIAVSLGLNAPARAENAPMWTGFYIGGNLGVTWGHSNITTAVDCSNPGAIGPPVVGYICGTGGVGAANAAALAASGSGKISDTAFTGGIQGGYNYKWNKDYVIGIEADFEYFNLNGSQTGGGTYPVAGPFGGVLGTPYSITTSFDTDWLVTLRGRLGWLYRPDLLFYFTGGVAFTRLEVAFNYSDGNGVASSGSAAATKTGWTIGGGVQWAYDDHWRFRAEYLYVDFGSVTASGSIGLFSTGTAYSNAISTSGDLTAHIARVGVDYRF
jgi:outer membrane immunogenic protein